MAEGEIGQTRLDYKPLVDRFVAVDAEMAQVSDEILLA